MVIDMNISRYYDTWFTRGIDWFIVFRIFCYPWLREFSQLHCKFVNLSANCWSDGSLKTHPLGSYEYLKERPDLIWVDDDDSAIAENVFTKDWQNVEYIFAHCIWPRIWLIVSKYIYSKFLRIPQCILWSAVFMVFMVWFRCDVKLSNSGIWWFNRSWRELALVNFPHAMQKFFNWVNLGRTRSRSSISLWSSIIEAAIIYTRIKKINEQLNSLEKLNTLAAWVFTIARFLTHL